MLGDLLSKEEKQPIHHNPYLHDLIWEELQKHGLTGKLLDIPSGPGYFARKAKQAGLEVFAGEIDTDLHVFNELTYKQIDMSRKIDFESESFDYIVSIEGIEHIENQALFLRECYRILKRGGRLFLTTPNVSSLEARLNFFFTGVHDDPPGPVRDDLPNIFMEHVNLIPFHRLEIFMRCAGIEIEKLTTYRYRKGSQFLYPFVYPFAWLRHKRAFKKYYAHLKDSERYHRIMKMFLTKEVLCGSHLVVVGRKIP